MVSTTTTGALQEVAERIRELRILSGYTEQEMSRFTGVSLEDYQVYEAGETDLPFTFIHKCALTFGVEIMELMEGDTPRLTGYAVTRRGKGQLTAKEPGIEINSIAPLFKNRKADPYWVRYEYSEEEQRKPIHQVTHKGQEFDLIIEGRMKIKIGEHTETLGPGDSIYYDSGRPHGIIAVGGADCTFLAVILADEEVQWDHGHIVQASEEGGKEVYLLKPSLGYMDGFITAREDETGYPLSVEFHNTERFNFAFDVVDAIAEKEPNRLAMIHLDREKRERRFTFGQMKKMSARAANYFRALGVRKGDRVMLVMRRNWEFWPVIVGLHKLGAIAIPATDQLVEKDFEYRFQTAQVSAIVCTAYGNCAAEAEKAMARCPSVRLKVVSGGARAGWHSFDDEYEMYSSRFTRTEDSIQGSDTMLMLFSSGTSGYPKAVDHSCRYPLGHYVTARYWHCVDPDGLHLTISDTGWGKALWGKLYGQWMNGCATFVYDFDRFSAEDILPLFAQYRITTFCAPPTMYRFFIKEDLSRYDLSSIQHATIAGEAMNPEVYEQFRKVTGLSVMEGFGQTETTLVIGNFVGTTPKPGSMGKPNPMYSVELMDAEGRPEGTDDLKKEIQDYVKKRTAPYKYPRIVEFRDELPKTISGKIIRNKL